jgi:phosphoribosylformimino-5-aminoimidazole carboxamide ribotide isomerase
VRASQRAAIVRADGGAAGSDEESSGEAMHGATMMKRIPVIDLMAGQVVRAVRGERATYRPVQSRLCTGSAPLAVARALLDHCAADTLYVADLEALTGGAPQIEVLTALRAELPGIDLWLDAGFASAAAARAACARLGERVTPVLASAALRSAAELAADAPCILSLDCKAGVALDRGGCWQHPQRWPQRLIAMTLDRVGADAGPDLDTLRALQAQAGGRALYGAGGIRHEADLHAAQAAGAAGWLLASALHDLRIPRSATARRG